MPILNNPRHERFAQALAAGKPASDAYVEAGYKENRHNAAALAREEHISTRVHEILAKGAERAEITVENVLRELAKLGFANMADYMRVGADGDPCLDFSALTRDQAAALQEVTVEDFKDARGGQTRDVRKVKFKLADKRAALVDIGKHLGMFIDRSEVGKPGEFDELTTEQKRERILGRVKELGVDRIGAVAGSA
ncbi:terminase small subunit [Bradyrhizobium japonicum]|uniref:terminase small subunit n=1 Tax=Bradyrhizobium japonicum TaxID=375 RepID=UPI0003FAF7B1|nr:terminase small subunit [Bradyrhizobium japonicum]